MEQFIAELKSILPHIDFEHEAALVSGGILDSLSLTSIIMMMSEKYGVEVSVDDMSIENFDSASAMYGIIENSKRN